MLIAAIVAAVAAFGLLVVGLVTGQVWLAIACVIASVIGLVLLLVDIRRGASAGKVADAPTTGAFLGEDVDAFVAQREARRDSGAFAAVAGTGAVTRRAVGPLTQAGDAIAGFREAEPDFTGPLYLGQLDDPTAASAGQRPAPAAPTAHQPAHGGPFPEATPEQPIAASSQPIPAPNQSIPAPGQPFPAAAGAPSPIPAPPVVPPRPAQPPYTAPTAAEHAAPVPAPSGPAFTVPTVSATGAPGQPPTAQPPRGGRRRVGDLHDYVTSTGSIPRVETSGANPTVVGDPEAIRWEASIPPSGSALVSDQSREAIRHVNDLPPEPPQPRRPRSPEPRRSQPIDALDPNWRPPQD